MYLIETTDKNGRWYALGSDPFEHIARAMMRQHQNQFPHHAIRIFNQATQKAVAIVLPRRQAKKETVGRFRRRRKLIKVMALCAGIGFAGWYVADSIERMQAATILQVCSRAPLDQSCIKRIYSVMRLS